MALFVVKTEAKEPEVFGYFYDVNEKLQSDDLTKNQYKGGIKHITNKNFFYWFINMRPVWFGFWKFGVFPLIPGIIFLKWWLIIPALILLSFGFFWSKYFLYLLLRRGIRKKTRYKGVIKLVSNREALEVAFFGSD